MIQEALTADITTLIRDVVLDDMHRFGAIAVDVTEARDHDGDASLKVDVHYDGQGDPVDPDVMAGLLFKVHERLWKQGETRFPYIRHHFPDAQKVVGFR